MAILGEFEVAARAAEGAEPDQFRFCGEVFTVADKVGLIPLGRFAKAATSGLDTADMEGMAALVDLIAEVVVNEDGPRFLDVCARNRADVDDLMPIVQAVIAAASGRPTQQPSDSSGGLSPTGANSRASSPFGQVPPILLDPRVKELRPVEDVALSLVG